MKYRKIKIKDKSLLDDSYKKFTGESAIITPERPYPKTINGRRIQKFRILFCYDCNIVLKWQWKFIGKVKHLPLLLPVLESTTDGSYYISDTYLEQSDRYKRILEEYKVKQK